MSVENETGAESDWWEGAIEEDTTWNLPLEDEGGLWSSGFLPPPPRPAFLDEFVTPDGLTTCDLCTWARSDNAGQSANGETPAIEIPGTLSWTLTLVIVSLISALIGAAIMVSVMQCRNRSSDPENRGWCFRRRRRLGSNRPEENNFSNRDGTVEGDKELVTVHSGSGGGVWTWLTRRNTAAPTLAAPVPTIPATNHYTLEEPYTSVGEALYAELDRPAYQNTGYVSDADPVSSAPSSAYYSDLSAPDRTYEAVGGQTGLWEMAEVSPRRQAPRLAAITETISVPSDYV